MIRKLVVQGFTVFPDREEFEFVPGMNIVVGGNDSGKSHLLKLSYALSRWSSGGGNKEFPDKWAEEQRLRKDIMRVFSAHDLTGLTARNRGNGYAAVEACMSGHQVPEGMGCLEFNFTAGRDEEGLHIKQMPKRFLNESAIFLTAREVFAIYPSFIQLGTRFPEALDGACWDLCMALDKLPLEKLDDPNMGRVLARIEKILGGRVIRQDGRFYMKRPGQELMEMSLVAEGFKRLGTLGCLIQNGSVGRGSILFWDEPEMNLNASHLERLVKVFMELSKAGVQLILTSHSLFLLRELVIQLAEKKNEEVSRKFFGLKVPKENRFGVRMTSAGNLDELGAIESLEAEIEQADRYMQMI